MRIAIIGAGGVGGYFGGRLAQAGNDVTFIARGAHLSALRTHGLRLESINGDAHIPHVQATDTPTDVEPVDIIIVSVKAWQLPDSFPAIRALLGPQTGIVPLLNGVEASDTLAAEFGAEHTLNGLCYVFAFLAEPGLIRHVGIDPIITFGERDNQASTRATAFRELLERAGIHAQIAPDIRAAVWSKFVFGATTSGLGAVTRAPMGLLRSRPETAPLFAQGMHETVAVGRAHGVLLPDSVVDAALNRLHNLPYATTASMQRDIMEAKPSELEAQNGAIVRLGRTVGVPTPLHDFIYAALLPQELLARRAISSQ